MNLPIKQPEGPAPESQWTTVELSSKIFGYFMKTF